MKHQSAKNVDTEALKNEVALLKIQHEAAKKADEAMLSAVKVGTVQTRSRDEVHAYVKAVAAYYFGSMAGFHKVILKYYLEEQPWKYPGWAWAAPKSTYIYAGGITTLNPGWCQYNITAPIELIQEARQAHRSVKAHQPDVSLAVFLYTMLIWGIANYFPPRTGVKHAGPEVERWARVASKGKE